MGDKITFEISDICSGGLCSAIRTRGWQNQKTFSLPIVKGPVFCLLEELIPDCVCLFHIGCSSDQRPPSFAYKMKYINARHELLIFSYQRFLHPEVLWGNEWFHDANGERDLEKTAEALSDPANYYEEIILFCNSRHRGGIMVGKNITLRFKKNLLQDIRGLGEAQDNDFKDKLIGFKGSLLDLTDGPLKNSRDIFLNEANPSEWKKIFQKNGTTADDLIKTMIVLFQASAPQFGERMRIREPLLIFERTQ